jgi:H+-transporting ATPase
MVWAYALVSFMVGSMIKIGTYRLLEYRAEHQVRHLTRVESHVAVPKQAAAPNITKG